MSSNNDDDSLSSSSSSDDEYLIDSNPNNIGGGEMSQEDREAMIRKKLLESFYGASSASMPLEDDNGEEEEEENEDDDEEEEGVEPNNVSTEKEDSKPRAESSSSTKPTKNSLDLDSPSFNPLLHSRRHIQSSSISTLLTTNENLSLDIRSLDSTMQTLVYENYSKFIDATDAIRSIGQSVHDSEVGLDRLKSAITNIEARTTDIEQALATSRDAVAEKLRVKRLLNRLSALLSLPSTLRTYISTGKYRLAAKSHVSATAILTKHSAGFESLKSIELECNVILKKMVRELRGKIVHWSGEVMRRSPLLMKHKHLFEEDGEDGAAASSAGGGIGAYSDDDEDEDEDEVDEEDGETPKSPSKLMLPPPPPESISEIFECSGTLLLLATVISNSPDKKDVFAVKFSKHKCKSLALDACGRLLSRRLDMHGMEIKEETERRRRKNKHSMLEDEEDIDEEDEEKEGLEGGQEQQLPPKSYLIPIQFLDGILESVTLYNVTFSTNTATAAVVSAGGVVQQSQPKEQSVEDQELLCDFVEDMFRKFLGYVKGALLERSLHCSEGDNDVDEDEENDEDNDDDEEEDDEREEKKFNELYDEQQDDEAFADISHALTTLLRSVRDLASGLALPEVGLDVRVASSLVDKTVEITESMVRRRIGRKFHSLKFRILKDCLGPFVESVLAISDKKKRKGEEKMEEGGGGGGVEDDMAHVVQVVQSASVTLSDGMQLVDDTIRDIFSRRANTRHSVNDDDDLRRSSMSSNLSASLNQPHMVLGGVMAAPVDSTIVKLAVRRNARRLALWLANAFEIAAGCEPAGSPVTLEVRDAAKEGEDGDDSEDGGGGAGHRRIASGDSASAAAAAAAAAAILDDDVASLYSDDDGYDLYGTADDEDDETTVLLDSIATCVENASMKKPNAKCDLTLAIAEMCRLAERSVAENMSQSIVNATTEEAKNVAKAAGLFGKMDSSSGSGRGAAARGQQVAVDSDGTVAMRFRSAASRALALYATDRGSKAAEVACEGFFESAIAVTASSTGLDDQASVSDSIPSSPREGAWKCLEIAALASIDCANVFGGERAAGPVPPFPDDDGVTTGHHHRGHSGLGGSLHGLQLDVERMFTERVQIYSHPSIIMEFTRNAVVATVLKVAFRALLESSRLCEFTEAGYRQMQVDVEFLRHMVPHYVKDDFMDDGTNGRTSLYNLLNDVMLNVGQRCIDAECVGVDEYYDPGRACIVTPLSIVREFMRMEEEKDSGGVTSKFVLLN